MTEETVQPDVNDTLLEHDPSLDHDDHADADKGATIGGIGGAVTGAVVGSIAGPVGTLAGAIIGGIVGAATSKVAVGAIDNIEHNQGAHSHDADDVGHGVEADNAHETAVAPKNDPD